MKSAIQAAAVKSLLCAGALMISALAASPTAHAEVDSLACYGVSDSWTKTANALLLGVENAVNEKVDQYVSLLNFDLGNSSFAVNGSADLGQLRAPPFSCADPKAVLKSGIADIGLSPRYQIGARILGIPVQVVDARMRGGQGPRASVNREPGAVDRLTLSVKVLGLDVMNKTRRGPEVDATQSAQSQVADQLPSHEKMGTGGKLIDITRSLSDTLGGMAPRFDIIAPFLYVTLDAGFYLQSELIFTYGVASPFFNASGSASFAQLRSSLERNPANSTDGYCEVAEGGSGACVPRSGVLNQKSREFYELLKGSTQLDDSLTALQRQVREVRVAELLQDARITRQALGSDWEILISGSLTQEERQAILNERNLGEALRPLNGSAAKVRGVLDQAKGVRTAATQSLAKIRHIASAFRDGTPEMQADGGVALSGKAGAWASAMLVLDSTVAKGWAGVEGRFTLIDIRAGLGAHLSSRSQYLDLTASLEQVRMAGELNLIYGVSVGVDPMKTDYAGSKNIVRMPGTFSRKQWLAGRVDFRPAGRAPLFWCWDVFGESVIDQERCSDGSVSNRTVDAALAMHEEMKATMFNEPSLNEAAGCIVADASGRPISTLAGSGVGCSSVLPVDSASELSPLASGATHPLELKYQADPKTFLTCLRNDRNMPAKTFIAASSGSQVDVRTYFSDTAIQAPALGGSNVLDFAERGVISVNARYPGAALKDRIFSLPYQATVVEKTPGQVTRGQQSDPTLQIQMDFAHAQWPEYAMANLFVGDASALPNDLLVEMAKTYRVGRCAIRSEGEELYLSLAGRPYPFGGDAEGRVSVNLRAPGTCFMGENPDTTQFADPRVAYAACAIREALQSGDCFPRDRVQELVQLANLSDEDSLRFFLGSHGSPKRITGEILPRSREVDVRDHRSIQVAENKDTKSGESKLFGAFFEKTGYGVSPYDTDEKRCGIPRRDGADPAKTHENHWFERKYHSNGVFKQASHELILHSHPSTACYQVGLNSSAQAFYPVGTDQCATNAFKSTYSHYPASGGKADAEDGILCSLSNPSHRDRAASSVIPALKNAVAGAPRGAAAVQLIRSIKDCMAGDTDRCVYTPTDRLGAEDGGSRLASVGCAMKVAHNGAVNPDASNSFDIAGPAGTQSLDGCILQATSPSFQDSQMFCQDPAVKPELERRAISILEGQTRKFRLLPVSQSKLNGDVVFDLNLRRETEIPEIRFIGRCFVQVKAGTVTAVAGQTVHQLGRGLAGTTSGGCALRVRKSASAGQSFHVTSAAPDDIVDPMSNSQACWKALGFKGESAFDQAKANEYCSAMSAQGVIGMFQMDAAALTQGTDLDVRTVSAELFSQRNLATDRTQGCEIRKTVKQWKELLDTGRCSLKLVSSSSATLALPQEILIPSSGGASACGTAASIYSGENGCRKLCALPAYLPFNLGGAQVTAQYASAPLAPPAPWNCSCAFDPNGDQPSAENSSCLAQGQLLVNDIGVEAQPFFSTPLRSENARSVTDAELCHQSWMDLIQPEMEGTRTNATYCAGILSGVQARLVEGGYVPSPQVSGGQYSWKGTLPPLSGEIPVRARLSSLWMGSVQEQTVCEYGFIQKDGSPANSPETEWILRGRVPAQLAFDAKVIDFGALPAPMDTDYVSRTVKLTNHSQKDALQCEAVTTEGENLSDFAILQDTCSSSSSFEAGATCEVKLSPILVGNGQSQAKLIRKCSLNGNTMIAEADLSATGVVKEWPLGHSTHLYSAMDIAVDPEGYVYLSGRLRSEIIKLNASGEFVKRWGSGARKKSGPLGLSAPSGLHFHAGQLLVADRDLHRIVVYTKKGEFVRTWGSQGSGPGQFNQPRTIVVSADGDAVYVSDTANHRIQQFKIDGTFVREWGELGAGPAQFKSPTGIAISSNGSLHVVDAGNNRVQVFTKEGVHQFTFGSAGRARGQFDEPSDIAISPNGEIHVAERSGAPRIQVFDSSGVFLRTFGSWGYHQQGLSQPEGLAFDSQGRLWVANTLGRNVRRYANDLLEVVWGAKQWENGGFRGIYGVAHDSVGNMYLADQWHHRIQKFDRQGRHMMSIAGQGLNAPTSLVLDAAGNIYVTEYWSHGVKKFGPTGTLLKQWGGQGTHPENLQYPGGITLDQEGNVYVAQQGDRQSIKKFSSDGVFISGWGAGGSGDGQFSSPMAIITNSDNQIVVLDRGNRRLQTFTPSGMFVSKTDFKFSGGWDARDVKFDPAGNIYVGDIGNHQVMKFDSQGVLISRIGAHGYSIRMFDQPIGLSFNPVTGELHVGEHMNTVNGRVQKFTPGFEPVTE